MRKLGRLTHSLMVAALGLLVLCCLAPAAVAAQGLPPPLPLPDVTVYGTVTRYGEVLAAGTVQARLPNGTAVTAPIGPIDGTAYNYALVLPLFMTATTTLSATGAGILTGDVVAFFVDEQPAFYQDPATQLTMGDLQVLAAGGAKTAAGRAYAIDLALRGPESYALGDVNANGVRNAADAMLALKYDIGLISGVTAFPPGPNTAYLPLCDLVENGRCDSSDALRILQCDVGLRGVTCPPDPVFSHGRARQAPAAGAPVTLALTATLPEPAAATVAVQVHLADPTAQFGAATLELAYDPARFAVTGCTENPAGALDLVGCNASYAPGVVRFVGIAAGGPAEGAPLVAVQFQRLDEVAAELETLFALHAAGVFDQAGDTLAWSNAAAGATPPDTPAPPDTPDTPAAASCNIYLPAVTSRTASAPAAGEDAPVTPVAFSYLLHLPVVNLGAGAAAGEAVAPTAAPTAANDPDPDLEPTAEPAPTVAPPAPLTPTPGATPAAAAPPVASPPSPDQPAGGGDAAPADGQQLYLPFVAED